MVSSNSSSSYASKNSLLIEEENEDVWLPLEHDNEPMSVPAASSSTSKRISMDQRTGSTRLPPRNMAAIQQTLQINITLKQKLVDHPLSQFGGLFVRHFASQVWELDLHVRFGVVLVMIGLVLQTIVVTWQWCHPSTILIGILFGASAVYLSPKDVEQQWLSLVELVTSSPIRWLDFMHPTQFRNLFIASLLIPTWLELKTLGFLSMVVMESGWKSNLAVSCLIFYSMQYRTKCYHVSPRDNLKGGILILYGCALLLAIYSYRFGIIPKVGGPFCLSTGSLLLSLGAWTVITRHALRLTLRDVLATVSQNVQQDEMLQLAMLRWLVDYWSNTPEETSSLHTSTEPQTSSTTSRAPTTPSTPLAASKPRHAANNIPRPTASQSTSQGIQWDEMWTMLHMTTEQMQDEIPQSNNRPTLASNTGNEVNPSLLNLNAMLSSMDVDQHAKPAVDAYNQMVGGIPPPPHIALAVAILRRCPAGLILAWRCLIGSSLALPSTLLLLPFVVTEVYRVLGWAGACHRAQADIVHPGSGDDSLEPVQTIVNLSKTMDAMTILLSGDNYSPHRPPALLQVWINVQSSVTALEMGLTAARCAQTTAAAADFAGHILSLAHLGVEVSHHGWLHGLAVLAQELVHMHAAGAETSNTKYTSAAMGAIRKGQIVVKNVKVLSEEEDIHPLFEPVIGVLSLLSGRGWLWGHEERIDAIASSVTITEIREEKAQNNDAKEVAQPSNLAKSNVVRVDEGGESAVAEDDLSSLMEQIADTFQRGLISESEKNAFMVMLSGKQIPTHKIIEGIRSSLRCAISNEDSEPIEPIDAATKDIFQHTVKRELSSTEAMKPEANFGVLSQCSSWEETHDDNEEKAETVGLNVDEHRKSIAENGMIRSAENQPGTGHAPQNEGGDFFKWVGGGLAIVGAVVGGVALMNASKHGDDNRFSSSRYESTVTIEELDGDDEHETDDTWVTVSSDHAA